ncbi:MAG: hypothetical protein OK456_06245, partial [Thaumarchaeota archaeon]|nr:hypothetical protein [Nitrososphaerota archaeon]
GNWQQVGCTLSSTGTMTAYVNGAAVSSSTGWSLVAATKDVQVGAQCSGAGSTSCSGYFTGSIEDVGIYNIALNSIQVGELYANTGFSNSFYSGDGLLTSLNTGMVGYWPLNEGTSYITADDSGNANPGTLVNQPTWQTSSNCKYGDCLSFAGASSQYVTVPSVAALSFPTSTSSFSISFWVKVTSTPSSPQALVSKSGVCSSCGDTGYGVRIENGGTLSGYLMSGGTVIGSASGSGVISNNVWYSVVFVDNAGSLTLYLDGSSYATATATLGSIGNSNPLTFGSDGTNGMYFTGSLDDVRVYEHALTGTQASTLHSESAPAAPYSIFDAIVGKANWQNGPGTSAVTQETFYQYDSRADMLTQEQLHNGGWITTSYTYDKYGNMITMTNPLGTVAHYHYSSTYSNAYLTLTSALVTTSGTGTLALDGSATCSSGSSNSCTMSLTTSKSNDVIIVIQSAESSGGVGQFAAVTDTSSLTWHNRDQVCSWTSSTCSGAGGSGTPSSISEDYAVASSPLSTDTITCKQTGNTNAHISCVAFAISGANTASPFDSASGLPCVGRSGNGVTGTSFSCTLSTSNAADMILGESASSAGSGTLTLGTGFSTAKCNFHDGDGNACGEEEVVSSTQSSLSVGMTSSVSVTWAFIGDAVVASSSATQNVTQSYTYNSTTGYMLSSTDGNGYTTSYKYDNLGRATLITYPAVGGVSGTTTYSYNDASNYVTITDANGNVVKQFYDGLARITSVERFNGSTLYSTQTFTYNWLNLVASNETANSGTYSYAYDQDGRITKATNPDLTTVTTTYNVYKNTKTVIDENGHPTVFAYDRDGRQISVEQFYTSTKYYTTSYTYDLSGNLLGTTDANAQTTSYKYDDLNRLVKTTYPGSSYEAVSYDALGNKLGMVEPSGSVLNYTYDALNRLTKITYPGSSTQTYAYDDDGNVLSSVDSSASIYYTYDARDWVTNQTEVISGHSYQIDYGYDKVGNVNSITYPGGFSISLTYDALNRMKTLGGYATIYYNLDDEVSEIKYGNGEVTTYSYDSRDRITQIDLKDGSTKELDLNYTYDGDSDVKTINSETFHYNWLDQLISSSGIGSGNTTFAYDGAGNMLNQTLGTTTKYTYGTYNELTSIGKVNFTYDGNGNTHTIVNGSTTWTYSYDYQNELTQVQKGGTTVAQYSYGGNGMLLKSVETDTIVYAYQGDNRLFQENTGSSSMAKFFYADGLLIASLNGSATSYYHQDALGSVRLVSSSSVTTIYSANYKVYGAIYSPSGSSTFQYTDKPCDPATGLYYSGARWYDSASGRFMTEDTMAGQPGMPLSLDRYVYALDNPMTYVDPTGHDPVTYTSTYTDTTASSISWTEGPYTNYFVSYNTRKYSVTTTCYTPGDCVTGASVLVSSTSWSTQSSVYLPTGEICNADSTNPALTCTGGSPGQQPTSCDALCRQEAAGLLAGLDLGTALWTGFTLPWGLPVSIPLWGGAIYANDYYWANQNSATPGDVLGAYLEGAAHTWEIELWFLDHPIP